MKLYFSPGACSLSPHIVARAAGIPIELVKTDIRKKTLPDGSDFRAVNPKGYVPALELDDGRVLTEGPAIVQYLADLAPESGVVPKPGTFERYRAQEWLTFIGTEIHKTFGVLFNPNASEDTKQQARDRIALRFDWVATQLGDKPFLAGDKLTAPDAYLFTVLRWAKPNGIDLTRWPALVAYAERVGARPEVKAALDAEDAASRTERTRREAQPQA